MTELQRYRRWALWTIYAVYFLILVGGIVRATGSGMGCPDWPKCFGRWIPPTNIAELPADYKDVYRAKRIQKNERVAKMLTALGFDGAAKQIVSNPSIGIETDFNPVKTWIEYINRLIGVLIGLLIVGTTWFGWRVRRHSQPVLWLSVLGLVLVLFQAWLGSIVVSANLLPFIVTLHMLLALALVGVLIYAMVLATTDYVGLGLVQATDNTVGLRLLTWGVLAVYIAQMMLGTQVREQIDVFLTSTYAHDRTGIVEAVGSFFLLHRGLSYGVMLVLFLQTRKFKQIAATGGLVNKLIRYQQIVVAGSLLTGVAMAYLGLPPAAQPIHLLLGSGLIGFQLVVVLLLQYESQKTNATLA